MQGFKVHFIYKIIFKKIHEKEWDKEVEISDSFTLKKYHQKIEEIELADNFYNLVYFDAFAPDVNPELWTENIFCKTL